MRIYFTVVLLLLGGALPAPADAQTLGDNSEGRVHIAGNELITDSKHPDPAASRLGSPNPRSLGKISFDFLDGSRDEHVLIQGKRTEDGTGAGEFYLGLKKPHSGSTDEAMGDAVWATWEAGFRFNLPIYAPNLGAGAGGPVVVSPKGCYRTYQQDDGNYVTYRVMPPDATHEAEWLKPHWSSWHGLIEPHPWAPC